MNQRSHLSVVREQSLPPPLLPAGIDLEDLPSFMIDVDWVTNPRFWSRVPRDAKMAAVELQVASTMESPAGSLPSDDEGLALAAGLLSDVDAWRRVADLALRGWTLCADGRYYRADVAKKMLHVWIVRLNDRRRGAAGQAKKRKEEFDPSQFDADIAIAVASMTRLDPYAPILRNYRNAQPDVEAASATAPSNAPSNSKLSEAKLSEAVPFGQSPNGARDAEPERFEAEIGEDRDGPPHPTGGRTNDSPDQAYPPGAFGRWWEDWPNKVGIGAAERAFAKVQRSGLVGFGTLMAALARYKRCKPVERAWCNPATWLNQKRWLDEWPAEVGRSPPGGADRVKSGPGSGDRVPPGHPGSEPSITYRATLRAAERLGLLDEPRPRG